MAIEVTDASFDGDVLHARRPIVVDFWAPWCGPCKVVESTLARLAGEHGEKVAFARLNVDENPIMASRYGVLSLPTAILFEGGEPRQAVLGARSQAHYERVWEAWLRPAP